MSRKSLVAALTLVLAIAVAVPTVAQQADPSLLSKSFANKTAKKAKQIAKQARSLARSADRKAQSAKSRASQARTQAHVATEQVTDLEQQVASQRVQSATASGTVETAEDTEYVSLGGPSVTVQVPQSGMIEVSAQVTIAPEGAVSLFEDGNQVPGQDPNVACPGPEGALLAHEIGDAFTVATPTGAPLLFCGNSGPPSPVVFRTTPGEHTYELRYADCGCDSDPAEFSDRSLIVAPRP